MIIIHAEASVTFSARMGTVGFGCVSNATAFGQNDWKHFGGYVDSGAMGKECDCGTCNATQWEVAIRFTDVLESGMSDNEGDDG